MAQREWQMPLAVLQAWGLNSLLDLPEKLYPTPILMAF